MKIFLLGLPGSGKTTLGKAVSEELSLSFVDLDLEIERQAGKKIKEIFSEQGENQFRTLESLELKRWCTSPAGFVMATGGGTPCFFNNMEKIKKAGTSVFLDVPVGKIVERMEGATRLERPLLSSLQREEVRDKIGRLRSERIGFYRQATIILSGESITAGEVIKKINI